MGAVKSSVVAAQLAILSLDLAVDLDVQERVAERVVRAGRASEASAVSDDLRTSGTDPLPAGRPCLARTRLRARPARAIDRTRRWARCS